MNSADIEKEMRFLKEQVEDLNVQIKLSKALRAEPKLKLDRLISEYPDLALKLGLRGKTKSSDES